MDNSNIYVEAQTSRGIIQTTFFKKLLSIRNLLATMTLLVVVCMAVGLILLSIFAQQNVVNDLSGMVQQGATESISSALNTMFTDTESDLIAMKQFFDNATIPPTYTEVWDYLPEQMSVLWMNIRKRPLGSNSQLDVKKDGTIIGVESYYNLPDIYYSVLYNGSQYVETGWVLELNDTITSSNFSNILYQVSYPQAVVSDIVTLYEVLPTCDSPTYWNDLSYLDFPELGTVIRASAFTLLCHSSGDVLGVLSLGMSINSLQDALYNITQTLNGYILIMDTHEQLVATSTYSQIFKDRETRINVTTTSDLWIKQAISLLNGDFNASRNLVTINDTEYYLSVSTFQINNLEYIIVSLLDRDQFLGDTQVFVMQTIIAATLIAAAALTMVSLAVWYITKPLFRLSQDFQKMAQLDLDFEMLGTPRLFEVSILYKSFMGMVVALKSFKKFVPTQIIANIINSKREAMLELKTVRVTVLFQDIESFTSLSESMDAIQLALLTGEYMETMSEVLCAHGGTIDKYIGDCIMTLFNAPTEVKDHALAATKAAAACIEVLKEKNKIWKQQYGKEIHCRIGIHTGEMLAGNMGSTRRMNYTVIGDNVNVAARLEGINKHYGTNLIVSKAVLSSFPKETVLSRKLSKVRVSGKQVPMAIYEVASSSSPLLTEVFQYYEKALHDFKKRDFPTASTWLQRALELDANDQPSLRLQHRINTTTLSDDWTYVEDLTK